MLFRKSLAPSALTIKVALLGLAIVTSPALMAQPPDDVLPAENGQAEESSFPGTLFRWNSDAEPEGGPPGWDEPLASDRPDFTEASSTIGRGKRQLEMGLTFLRDRDPGSNLTTRSLPETLLRVGVFADWFELRVGWNYISETDHLAPLSPTRGGSEDLYLGVKLGLTPQQDIWPEMALVPQMTVPFGGPFGTSKVLPGMNWLYGWDISEFISTAGSTQANLALDDDTANEYLEFAQSWTIGYTLGEKLGAYTEWFVLVPAGATTARTEHYFDGGLTYKVTNNLQLDVRGGKGVSAAAIDYFGGVGAVVRF